MELPVPPQVKIQQTTMQKRTIKSNNESSLTTLCSLNLIVIDHRKYRQTAQELIKTFKKPSPFNIILLTISCPIPLTHNSCRFFHLVTELHIQIQLTHCRFSRLFPCRTPCRLLTRLCRLLTRLRPVPTFRSSPTNHIIPTATIPLLTHIRIPSSCSLYRHSASSTSTPQTLLPDSPRLSFTPPFFTRILTRFRKLYINIVVVIVVIIIHPRGRFLRSIAAFPPCLRSWFLPRSRARNHRRHRHPTRGALRLIQ